jgi:hypothetical protein
VQRICRRQQQILRGDETRPAADLLDAVALEHEADHRLGMHVTGNDHPRREAAFVHDDVALPVHVQRGPHVAFQRDGRPHVRSTDCWTVSLGGTGIGSTGASERS